MKKAGLNDLRVYQLSMDIGDEVWKIVEKWDYFQKDTIGKQLTRAIDSIAANISEGYGRFHFKENKHFVYYARGSMYESWTWINKAKTRNLIEEESYKWLNEKFKDLSVKLNTYLHSIGVKSEN